MKMLNFRKAGSFYFFQIGNGDDFWGTIAAIKGSFDPNLRSYNPETKTWSVPATKENEERLAAIFDNGASCIVALQSQLSMF